MRAITNYPPIGWKNKNEEKMKPQEMQARMGEYIGLIGSGFWYNVELSNGIKSRVILTPEQELQGLGKIGLSILVKTRPEDNRDNNFLVDFIKLVEP